MDHPQTAKNLPDLDWREARRRPLEFEVSFALTACTIDTLEGPVLAKPGDAVITGVHGERWPVPKAIFSTIYELVPPTQPGENGRYRRRCTFARVALLPQALALDLSDGRGSLSGNAGDWVVEQLDGHIGIVADTIFKQTYDLTT